IARAGHPGKPRIARCRSGQTGQNQIDRQYRGGNCTYLSIAAYWRAIFGTGARLNDSLNMPVDLLTARLTGPVIQLQRPSGAAQRGESYAVHYAESQAASGTGYPFGTRV